MPFFREEWHEYFDEPQDVRERLETAKWLNWCGWDKEARHILHEIAASIEESEEEKDVEESNSNEGQS